MQPSPQGAVENVLNFIGQDATELNPAEVETKLSMEGESPILMNDEGTCARYTHTHTDTHAHTLEQNTAL